MIHKQKSKAAPLFFVAHSPDGTRHIGTTPAGLQTHSGQAEFIDAESEHEVLIQTNLKGLDFTGYNPLPESPTPVKEGLYSYGSELVLCRKPHARGLFSPEETPLLFITHRDRLGAVVWIEDEAVERGVVRRHKGVRYRCRRKHTTDADSTPDTAGALWRVAAKAWVVQEEVTVGDIRRYHRVRYRCIKDHLTRVGKTPSTSPILWEVI
jgi:hypothetical protein